MFTNKIEKILKNVEKSNVLATLYSYNKNIVPYKVHDKEGDMMCILIYEEDWKRRLAVINPILEVTY